MGVISYRGLDVSYQSDQRVGHTHEVLEKLQDLLAGAQNMESSAQGFVFTGDRAHIESFSSSVSDAEQSVGAVRRLTVDNAGQQAQIPKLELLTADEIEHSRSLISLRQLRGMPSAVEDIRKGTGRKIIEEFQAVIHEMEIEELRLLALRDAEAKRRVIQSRIILACGSFLGMIIAAVAGWSAHRDSVKRGSAEQALSVEKERAHVTLKSVGDGVICTDSDGQITFLNLAAETMVGASWQSSLGRSITEIFRVLDGASRESVAGSTLAAIQSGQTAPPSNCVLIRSDEVEIPIKLSVAPINDGNGGVIGTVIVFRDVRVARAMAVQMVHSAKHDFLTDLPNSKLLNDRVGHAVTLARRHEKKVAILFLDLDGFKHVNHALGHPVGDKLLQSVGKRLACCIRAPDTVSRQGGDEFVILLTELERSKDAGFSARRMLQSVAQTHSLDDRTLHITASIGISIYPEDGPDAETLIKNAETAMFQAKENGPGNLQFFKPGMDLRAVERQSVEEDLRRALELHEFVILYQPKVNLRSGEITGAEALIRWNHPIRGLISPAQFISIAEDCGLILPIGLWVLRDACEQAKAWQDAGLSFASIAVNISALQFRNEHFLETIFSTLKETGLDTKSLELELTESVLFKRSDSAASALETLRAGGIRIAIDDFGTGYSSLSYLTRFPMDTLKIDQSFIRQMANSSDDAAIVTAIIGIGQNLKLRVVAEGVETREQLEFLLDHGCEEAQGYFFSRPVPPREFARLLRTGMRDSVLT